LEKEHDWLAQAVADPDAAVQAVIEGAAESAPAALADDLRQGKRRVALMAALADLGGAWALEKVTGVLSDFADAACGAALRAGLAAQIKRGKLPGIDRRRSGGCGGHGGAGDGQDGRP
jgi:glutamate-ammonia-ligase adenylyltransferase